MITLPLPPSREAERTGVSSLFLKAGKRLTKGSGKISAGAWCRGGRFKDFDDCLNAMPMGPPLEATASRIGAHASRKESGGWYFQLPTIFLTSFKL